MSIPRHARANLATLLRAAAGGNLALMECADAVTGEPRYVICAFGRDGTDFVFTLFGLSPTAIPSTPACRRPQPSQTSRLSDPLRRRLSGRGGSTVNGRAVSASRAM
ncbi:DUF6117 family protein [Rhodopila sp.]|jgi:hypothetical protein|uniref:DUF6117 family protein n=1 Tax=Rhodopila sp. TaxID=2480087 RepID=UPI002C505F60|nr:DUF6117 family protein [Rhodopila sp.]HVZ07907.1 DUF6117 family protein [Rhodopila sp.]